MVRQRWPAVTLAVTGLLWTIYHVAAYPGGAPAVPLWIALYSAATAPRRWVTLPMAGWLIDVRLARHGASMGRLISAAVRAIESWGAGVRAGWWPGRTNGPAPRGS